MPEPQALRPFLTDDDRSQVFTAGEEGYRYVKKEKRSLFCGVRLELDIHICIQGAMLEGMLSYIEYSRKLLCLTTSETVVM